MFGLYVGRPHLVTDRGYCARGVAEPFPPPEQDEPYFEPEPEGIIRPAGGFWALGGRLTWVSALVLTISAFTGWYARGRTRPGPRSP